MSGSEKLKVSLNGRYLLQFFLSPLSLIIYCLPTCKAVCEVVRPLLILKMSFPRGYFVTCVVPRLSTGQSQCFIWSGNGSNIKQLSLTVFK